jgi:hypothetical protein
MSPFLRTRYEPTKKPTSVFGLETTSGEATTREDINDIISGNSDKGKVLADKNLEGRPMQADGIHGG